MAKMDSAAAIELYRKLAREFGKQGGRPRSIMHTDEESCLCVECRKLKVSKAKKRVKKK